MPIYEYVCNACGHEFEEWQKISDAPVRTCPTCGKRKVDRLVSLSTFHLKGTGWYVTDYGGKKSGSEPHKKDAEKSDNKSEKKESQGESASSKPSKPSTKTSKSDE